MNFPNQKLIAKQKYAKNKWVFLGCGIGGIFFGIPSIATAPPLGVLFLTGGIAALIYFFPLNALDKRCRKYMSFITLQKIYSIKDISMILAIPEHQAKEELLAFTAINPFLRAQVDMENGVIVIPPLKKNITEVTCKSCGARVEIINKKPGKCEFCSQSVEMPKNSQKKL